MELRAAQQRLSEVTTQSRAERQRLVQQHLDHIQVGGN